MANYLKRLLESKHYAADGAGGAGGSGDAGTTNGNGAGGGEPNPNDEAAKKAREEEIQKEVDKRMAKQKAEIEAKVRKEIEDGQKLTDEEKLAKEREEFEKQKAEFEKQKIEQTKALNVEKIKNEYLKAGVDEKLVDKLVAHVGENFDEEKKSAEETIKIYQKILEDHKASVLAEIQGKQSTPKGSGDDDKDKNGFFSKYNERDTKEKKEPKNKYFK